MTKFIISLVAAVASFQASAEVLLAVSSKAFFSNCPAPIQMDILRDQGRVIVTPTKLENGCSMFKTLQPVEFKIDRDSTHADGRVVISASSGDQVLLIVDYRQSEARVIPKHAPDPEQPMVIKEALVDVTLLTMPQGRWFLLK
jgi:hypothetical protein